MPQGNRVEGQIWISRDEPNTLKYYAGNTEYWTVAATTYIASGSIAKGSVVALSATNSNEVVPAVWPRDARRIVGMALNSALNGSEVRALAYGYVELTAAEIEAAFVTQSDFMTTEAATTYYSAFGTTSDGGAGNGWNDALPSKRGLAAPVYFYTGRHIKTAVSTYAWQDPSAKAGRITFATPCGYKPSGYEIPWSDDKFNVAYKNLPQVGSVADYTYDAGTGKLTTLVLHINFALFDRAILFEYPAKGVAAYATASEVATVTLYHGLFPTTSVDNPVMPHLAVRGWGYSEAVDNGDGTYTASLTSSEGSFMLQPGYDSFTSGNTRRSEFELESDTTFYYKLVGEVYYNQ